MFTFWIDDLAALYWPWIPEDEDGLAEDDGSGDDDGVGPVAFALAAVLIVKVTWKRANTGARIGAILACLIVFWLAMALVNARIAGAMAAGTASGFSQLITGIGRFIGQL
jgi:hypothetical protein